jgi:hypothetical protein
MAEQMRPASPDKAPDPANSYERAHPGREAGMGRMDNNKATPQDAPDQADQAIANRQDDPRQVNAHDAVNQRGGPAPVQPDHSMKDEEPLGWDQAPQDITDPRQQRHPRKEGSNTGGTP